MYWSTNPYLVEWRHFNGGVEGLFHEVRVIKTIKCHKKHSLFSLPMVRWPPSHETLLVGVERCICFLILHHYDRESPSYG